MNAIDVRRATPEDLDVLTGLFDAYRVFYRKASDPESARAFLRARFAGDESVIFLALSDSQGVGFAQLYPTFSSVDLGAMWLLNDLYVDPAARRCGIATRLLEHAERLGRDTGAAKLLLRTAHDNRDAQRCYERTGWTLDERFRTYQKYL